MLMTKCLIKIRIRSLATRYALRRDFPLYCMTKSYFHKTLDKLATNPIRVRFLKRVTII
jgi:hypothetical protein